MLLAAVPRGAQRQSSRCTLLCLQWSAGPSAVAATPPAVTATPRAVATAYGSPAVAPTSRSVAATPPAVATAHGPTAVATAHGATALTTAHGAAAVAAAAPQPSWHDDGASASAWLPAAGCKRPSTWAWPSRQLPRAYGLHA